MLIYVGTSEEDIYKVTNDSYLSMTFQLSKALAKAGKRLDQEPSNPLFEDPNTSHT